MAKKEEIKVKLTRLNNKGRKGLYVYVKAKGRPARYYKATNKKGQLIPGITDIAEKYYEDKQIKKKTRGTLKTYTKHAQRQITKKGHKPIKRWPTDLQKYAQKLRKRPEIKQALEKGITTTIIKDARTTTQEEINKAKIEIIKPLALHPRFTQILIQHSNIRQLQDMLEYRIEFKNGKEQTLATAGTNNKTPEQVINHLKWAADKDMEITDYSPRKLKDRLDSINYQNYSHKRNGKLKRTQVQIILRHSR